MEQKDITKPVPYLNEYQGLEEKMEAISQFLKIKDVYCVASDLTDFTYPPTPGKLVPISEILGPKPSYIRSLANDWIDILREELDEFAFSESSYDEITELLQKLQFICLEQSAFNDMSNELKFEGNLIFYIQNNHEYSPLPFNAVRLDVTVNEELFSHYNIRKSFFEEFHQNITKALDEHLKPNKEKSPAVWVSENASLEIAEFLESLKYSDRLQLNVSYAKFCKEFYALFGYSSKNHNQKLQQIRNRINRPSYLHQLAEKIEERYHTKK